MPYDSEAEDYFTRVAAVGTALTTAEKAAFDLFITTLKSAGIWTKLVEVVRFAGTSMTEAVAKLKYPVGSPSSLTGVSAPVYLQGFGFQGNNSGYLTTGTTPNANGMTAADQSAGVFMDVGTYAGIPLGAGNTYVAFNGTLSYLSEANPTHSRTNRLHTVTTDGANVKTYLKGTLDTTTARSTTDTNAAISVLAYGTDFKLTTGYVFGYFLGKGLSAAEVAILSAAWDDLIPSGIHTNTAATSLGFGDSVTEGTGASDAAHRWINLVAAADGLTVNNQGAGGTELLDEGLTGYYDRVFLQHPRKIYVLYGLNDLRQSDGAYTAAAFQAALTTVITKLLTGWLPSEIVLGSPPYMDPAFYASYSPYNGGNVGRHEAFRDAVRAVAAAKATRYADVYQYMLDHGANSLISGDGVHPIDAGHAAIATAMLAAAPISTIRRGRVGSSQLSYAMNIGL